MRTTLSRFALLSILAAATARATPMALSATDVTWTTAMVGGVRSTLTLHLEDLAYSAPGIGLLQLTITGHVEQPAYGRHHLEVVGMEIYGDHGRSSLQAALLETEFDNPLASASTYSPTIAGPGTPTYSWIDYQTGIPSRSIDWSSTATLLVYGLDDQPKSVDFWSHYITVGSCNERGRCETYCAVRSGCETGFLTAGHLDVQVTAIHHALSVMATPEPSTGLLLALGLLGMAVGRSSSQAPRERWTRRESNRLRRP